MMEKENERADEMSWENLGSLNKGEKDYKILEKELKIKDESIK